MIFPHCLIKTSLLLVCVPKGVMCCGVIGIALNGRLEFAERLGHAALLSVNDAEVGMRSTIVGVVCEDSLKCADRLLKTALFPVYVPESVMRPVGKEILPQPERGLIFMHCFVHAFFFIVIKTDLIMRPGLCRTFRYYILP